MPLLAQKPGVGKAQPLSASSGPFVKIRGWSSNPQPNSINYHRSPRLRRDGREHLPLPRHPALSQQIRRTYLQDEDVQVLVQGFERGGHSKSNKGFPGSQCACFALADLGEDDLAETLSTVGDGEQTWAAVNLKKVPNDRSSRLAMRNLTKLLETLSRIPCRVFMSLNLGSSGHSSKASIKMYVVA